MKKIILWALLSIVTVCSYAANDNVSFFGIDLGYGMNYPTLSRNINKPIEASNGINIGVLNAFCSFLIGGQLYVDIDGKKPTIDYQHDFVDIAGAARVGFIYNWIGIGIDVGGYRVLHNYLGSYEQYNYGSYAGSSYVVDTKTKNIYNSSTYFNGGMFLTLRFNRFNVVGCYIVLETTHVNPIMAAFGININY